jgi:hypothetical protein
VNVVDRTSAVETLKEVLDACSQQSLSYVNIVEPTPLDNLSIGFQIQIKVSPPNVAINSIEPIVKKRGLSLKKEAGRLTIYEPQVNLIRV